MRLELFCIATMAFAFGCKTGGGSHGHSHGEVELPSESVTLWTDKAELFMKWSPLIVGQESVFAAHITDLQEASGFAAVPGGKVVLTVKVGSKTIKAETPEPARLGIFTPTITPDTAGGCTMSLALESANISETFSTIDCTIYPDKVSAQTTLTKEETPGEISFSKEQQWPIEFATVASSKQSLVPSKTINATIKAVPGHEARLTAGTSGRLSLEPPVPTLGSQVSKGQLLARIQPTLNAPGSVGALRADVAAAKAEHAAAKASFSRTERLIATDSVPKRRLEEATSQVTITKARLSAATRRLSSYTASASGSARPGSGSFQVSSPISGTLVSQSVTEGETTTAGSSLFGIVDLERVWVEGRIFGPDIAAFENSKSAWFSVDGRDTVFEVNEETGKLVTVGHVLDPKSRTLPVIFEVQNPNKVLRIGQYAKLSVATGDAIEGLVIPESAVLQDGNQKIVFVQSSGEKFVRRVVKLGTHSRGMVEVISGIKEGERVVTKGAYDVKLASSANDAPAHGHTH